MMYYVPESDRQPDPSTSSNVSNVPVDYSQWADYYGLGDYFGTEEFQGKIPIGQNPFSYAPYQEYLKELAEGGHRAVSDIEGLISSLVQLYNQGKISANDLSGYLQYLGVNNYDPTFEKWLDNQIALENTNSARNWEEQMASTDLLRSADQLKQLGLSSSGVLSTGGSAVNAVGAADNVKSNIQQQRYEQRMGMTKSLIGMVTGMASAGIGGAAMGLARNSLAKMAMTTSHNAMNALNNYKDFATTKIANNAGDIAHIFQLLGK